MADANAALKMAPAGAAAVNPWAAGIMGAASIVGSLKGGDAGPAGPSNAVSGGSATGEFTVATQGGAAGAADNFVLYAGLALAGVAVIMSMAGHKHG